MTRRRIVASGAAVVAVYFLALAGTVAMHDAHVRPLYDGIAPPPAYSWVDPPAFWAAGNVKPAATSTVVPLGSGGSAAAGIATPDGQLALDLGRDAIAPHGTDRDVRVKITPIDPKHLAPVPDGLRSNGNAYRVVMTYEPSQVAVATIAKPGSLLIEIPELGDRLFESPSGRTWSALSSQTVPPRNLSLSASFANPSYYLAATNLPELEGPAGGHSDHRSIELGAITAALAVVVLLAGFMLRRRRAPRSRSAV